MTLCKTDHGNNSFYWSQDFDFVDLGRIAAKSTDGVTYHAYIRQMFEAVEAELQVTTKDHDLSDRVTKYMTEFPFLCQEVTNL
jgi:hypothetical protein